MKYTQAGTYQLDYTATDGCGNETTVTRTITAITKATVLFADGTLIINEVNTDRDANIQSHGAVTNEYVPLDANNSYVFSSANDAPWVNERTGITAVEFGSVVRPTNMAYWFQNMSSLASIDWTNFDGSANTSLRTAFASTAFTTLTLPSHNNF